MTNVLTELIEENTLIAHVCVYVCVYEHQRDDGGVPLFGNKYLHTSISLLAWSKLSIKLDRHIHTYVHTYCAQILACMHMYLVQLL